MSNDAPPPAFAYQKLAAELRELAETLGANQPMPSITKLCRTHGLSVKTVRKAYGVLEEEGLVFAEPGLGMFRK